MPPALHPGAAAAAPHGQEPPTAWGLLFILAQKSFGGVWGAGGRGQLLSLRQKDAGQHFICNHLNVFAVFRIQNPGWGGGGRLGGGVRRASICSVDCTLVGGRARGSC